MISLILKKRQFLLYCIIGASGATLDTCSYSFLVKVAGLNYQVANCAGCMLGALLSFVLNAHFNFRLTDKIARRLAIFLGVAFLGLLVSAVMLRVLINVYHVNEIIAKIATLPVVVLLQYNLNRLISFRKTG